jgi:hypothetical protein
MRTSRLEAPLFALHTPASADPLKEVTEQMKLGLAIAAASLMAVSAFAALESGLKPDTPTTAFDVVDVSGPNKGKQLCYR